MKARSVGRQTTIKDILASAHLPALDGLRAMAVTVVIVYHLGFEAIPGDIGVSAFFVLSGFLISWLLLQEIERTGRISFRQFYARRALRIVPAYYVFLVLVYVQEHLRGYEWDPWLTISGFGYFVNYYNGTHGHPNTAIAHAWSLSVEQQFYVLWPILLNLLMRKGTRVVACALAGIIACVVGIRSLMYFGFAVDHSYLYNAFETRFDSIAVGCLVAIVSNQRRFVMLATVLSKSALSPAITLLLLCYSRIWGAADYHYSVGFTIDSLLLALFMVQLLILSRQPAWHWLDHPAMVYLGKISYSLYLYHVLAMGIASRLAPHQVGAKVMVSLVLCVLMASCSYWFIELPFLRLKHRLVADKKPSQNIFDPTRHATA